MQQQTQQVSLASSLFYYFSVKLLNDLFFPLNSEGKDFGQNMAWRFTPGDNPSDIDVALIGLQNWYNEEEYFRGKYSQSNPSGDNWFHFTQMVWKGTTDMGCATKRCGNSEIDWVTVCNYSEQGEF